MVQPGLRSGDTAHLCALLYLFTFELGKYRQEANHGLAERGRGVKALLHRNEVNGVGKKDFLNKIERVPLGAGEPVQLVDQHHVKLVRLGHELLHTGAFEVTASVPAIDVDVRNQPPLRLAVGYQALLLFAN